MKTILIRILFFSILVLGSCNGKKEKGTSSTQPSVKLTKAEVTRVVKNYFRQKFNDPIISENEGLVRIQGEMELVIFNQNKIFIGKLDKDETLDAIVTYGYEKTNDYAYDRHLILLNQDSLRIVNDFPAAMKIEEITARRVIALIDTSHYDLPHAPCASCQVLMQLRLEGDTLVREK